MAHLRWSQHRMATVWVLASLMLATPHMALASDESDASVGKSAFEPQPKVTWADRIRAADVHEHEPIVLIVHAAKDCVYCQRWAGSLGGKGEFESWANAHPDVHLFIVERDTIASAETVDDYPPIVRWLFERRQRLEKLSPPTPTFEIFVRRKILWQSYGLGSWDRSVFPALKDLDSRRVPSRVE